MSVNVYPSLRASEEAERKYRKMLDAEGFWRWDAQTNEFRQINRKQLADLEYQAARKRVGSALDRPQLLEASEARDHLCWMMRGRVDDIHLRRLFACHHTTVHNWRHRFKPERSASEVNRVYSLLGITQ